MADRKKISWDENIMEDFGWMADPASLDLPEWLQMGIGENEYVPRDPVAMTRPPEMGIAPLDGVSRMGLTGGDMPVTTASPAQVQGLSPDVISEIQMADQTRGGNAMTETKSMEEAPEAMTYGEFLTRAQAGEPMTMADLEVAADADWPTDQLQDLQAYIEGAGAPKAGTLNEPSSGIGPQVWDRSPEMQAAVESGNIGIAAPGSEAVVDMIGKPRELLTPAVQDVFDRAETVLTESPALGQEDPYGEKTIMEQHPYFKEGEQKVTPAQQGIGPDFKPPFTQGTDNVPAFPTMDDVVETPDPNEGWYDENTPSGNNVELGGKSGPTTAGVNTEIAATDTTEVKTNPLNPLQKFTEDKFGWDEDKRGDMSEALMQAGFTMMAGDSPYAMQNIGMGGLAGVQAYQGAKDQRRDEGLEDDAQRMKEELHELRMAEGNKRLADVGKSEHDAKLTRARELIAKGATPDELRAMGLDPNALELTKEDADAIRGFAERTKKPTPFKPFEDLTGDARNIAVAGELLKRGLLSQEQYNKIVAGDGFLPTG